MKHLLKDTKQILSQMPHADLMREADALSAELEGTVNKIYALLKRLDQLHKEERRTRSQRAPSFLKRVANALRAHHEEILSNNDIPGTLNLTPDNLRGGDIKGQSLGVTKINGVLFHIEAVEVVTTEFGQRAAYDESQELYLDMNFQERTLRTIKHNDKEYVVVIHPFGT